MPGDFHSPADVRFVTPDVYREHCREHFRLDTYFTDECNTSLDGITVYALDLRQPGGPVPYKSVQVGSVEGAIVAIRTLRYDADEREDLVVAVRDGSRGYLNFYVNLSPGDDEG